MNLMYSLQQYLYDHHAFWFITDDAVSYESYPLPDEGEDVKPAKEADKPVELPAEESGQAVALVVNAEVTSYLMMGALSPGAIHSESISSNLQVKETSLLVYCPVSFYLN